MKKRLCAVCFVIPLLTFIAAAQSKEEAISWLKEKMDKYGSFQYSVKQAEECLPMVNSQNYVSLLKRGPYNPEDTFPQIWIEKASQVSRSATGENFLVHQYQVCYIHLNDISNVSVIANCSQTLIRVSGKVRTLTADPPLYIDFILQWDSEPDLLQRMVKAFNYLIELYRKTEPF